jgi:AraC-like DNA-binding protein
LSEQALLKPDVLIDYKKYEQMILSAAKLTKQTDIGLKLGRRLSITSHGVLGFALLNCASLRHAIEVCQRYVGIRTPLLEVHLVEEPNYAILVIDERVNIDNIRQVFIESLLVSLKESLGFVVGHQKLFKKIELNYAQPTHHLSYQRSFDCQTSFDHQKCRLLLDKQLLDLPLRGRDEHSFSQAEALCKVELDKIKLNRQLAGQVYTLLMLSSPEQRTLSLIAEQLFLAPRTLHRHLISQGSHFKVILEQVKSEQAKTLLKQGKSVKTVAYTLGYNDSANFRRAFKRWEKITPQAFIQSIRDAYNQ